MKRTKAFVAKYVNNYAKTNLNYQELYTLLLRICIKLYGNTNPELQAVKVLLYQKFAALHAAMYKPQASPITPEVAQADQRRDSLVSALRHYLEYLVRMDNPTTKAAAERLLSLINQRAYKRTRMENYAEETALLANLIDELRGNFAADVQTVDMGELVEQLAEANALFNNIYERRSQEGSMLKQQQSVLEARINAVAAFDALRQNLNYLQTCYANSNNGAITIEVPSVIQESINGTAGSTGTASNDTLSATYTDYSALISEINLEIATIMETANTRHKTLKEAKEKKKKEKEPTENNTTNDTPIE